MNRLLVLLFILLFSTVVAFSQINNTLYFMHELPQAHAVNPAQVPNCKFFLGGLLIPVVGQLPPPVTFAVNLPLDYNDVLFKGRWEYKDSIITPLHPNANLEEFLNKLKKVNYTTMNFNLNLLYVGFKQGKKNFWSFDITEKAFFHFGIPKALITFPILGNGEVREASFSGFHMNMFYYRQFAIGFKRDITRYFHVGGKLKFLTGVANIYTSSANLTLYTEDKTNILTSASNYVINTNAPIDITLNDDGFVDNVNFIDFGSSSTADIIKDYALFTGNRGIAIDAGFSKEWNSELTYFANIEDFGYIKWNTNAHNFSLIGDESNSGGFRFEGVEMNDFNFSDLELLALDSLLGSFDFEYSENAYTTWLPWKIYAGAQYKFTKKFHIGAVGRLEKLPYRLRPSLTGTVNFNPGKISHFTLSYSIINGNYNNLGFGYALHLGPFQWFMVTDNLLGIGLFPNNSRSASIQMGANFVLGYKGEDSKQPRNMPLFNQTPSKNKKSMLGSFGKKRKDKAVSAPQN